MFLSFRRVAVNLLKTYSVHNQPDFVFYRQDIWFLTY